MILGPVHLDSRSYMPLASLSAISALLEGQFIAPDLEGRAVAQFEHVARPLEVARRPIPVDLAGLDVLADELEILGIDAIAILAQGDLGDFQHRLGLLDIRLGLEVADALAPLLFLVGGCVELRDDVPGLDAGPSARISTIRVEPGFSLGTLAAAAAAPSAASAASAATPAALPLGRCSVVFLVVSAALGVAGRAGMYFVTT